MTLPATGAEKKRILLVDDESDMTALVGRYLDLRGFATSSVNDAPEALELALGGDFDAIIMDLMMPRLDGFGVLQRLRQSERHAATPIIVLSARELSDEERKRLLRWDVRYLPKPFPPARLVDAVRDALARA